MNGALVGMDFLYQIRRYSTLDAVKIDGLVFRLHYWFTSTALFAASLIAFAKQYFGDPIECIFVSLPCLFAFFFLDGQGSFFL